MSSSQNLSPLGSDKQSAPTSTVASSSEPKEQTLAERLIAFSRRFKGEMVSRRFQTWMQDTVDSARARGELPPLPSTSQTATPSVGASHTTTRGPYYSHITGEYSHEPFPYPSKPTANPGPASKTAGGTSAVSKPKRTKAARPSVNSNTVASRTRQSARRGAVSANVQDGNLTTTPTMSINESGNLESSTNQKTGANKNTDTANATVTSTIAATKSDLHRPSAKANNNNAGENKDTRATKQTTAPNPTGASKQTAAPKQAGAPKKAAAQRQPPINQEVTVELAPQSENTSQSAGQKRMRAATEDPAQGNSNKRIKKDHSGPAPETQSSRRVTRLAVKTNAENQNSSSASLTENSPQVAGQKRTIMFVPRTAAVQKDIISSMNATTSEEQRSRRSARLAVPPPRKPLSERFASYDNEATQVAGRKRKQAETVDTAASENIHRGITGEEPPRKVPRLVIKSRKHIEEELAKTGKTIAQVAARAAAEAVARTPGGKVSIESPSHPQEANATDKSHGNELNGNIMGVREYLVRQRTSTVALVGEANAMGFMVLYDFASEENGNYEDDWRLDFMARKMEDSVLYNFV
ncbi:hypothetical protein QBC37DRAFT_404792 [Rhypophila decipiens]|uniref:Uncharacterized protein n=1 Tax=Rhypophila decipiens TaxID=261697 RepID=A0AAN7B5L8_9PEZI|nr:hypothetical protein QBC37DRAFT_404792 [Rhypophila decipiens]